jgi:hypothetical protein
MSALPVTVDLSAYRGDSWAQTFRFLEGGEPVDLADPVVVACWAKALGREPLTMRVTKGEPGEVTIAQPEDGLDCGSYRYDVEVRDNGDVTTWVRGTLAVTGDVTNADVDD